MFKFIDLPFLTDNEIDIHLALKCPEVKEDNYVPMYCYNITLYKKKEKIGWIDLRVGYNENIYYGGHIGYGIDEDFRGNNYAFKAVKLIFKLASRHNMNKVLITCNPNNLPSVKTIIKAGGKFIETVAVPENQELYETGERFVSRYEISL